MIEARPRNFFSRHYSLEAAGQPLAELDASRFKEAAALTVEGAPYRLFREGLFSGDFVLEKDGRPLLKATKLSAFRSQFDFELDGRLYSLKRASFFGKTYEVRQSDRVVGSVSRAALFSRRALVDLPAVWPVPEQAFLFWLVLLMWKRQERDVAGAVASAAAGS
jgi:hypothetical protein